MFVRFKEWKTMVEKQNGKQVKTLRTYNRLEFCNTVCDDYCKEAGIVRHLTVRHTPHQNGVVERMNQTLLQRARCMRLNVGLSWVEVVNIVVYLVNRFSSTVIDLKTPQEVWSGKPSNYFGLRIFGCPAYAHVNDGKLEPREMKCIFLGYPMSVKGYRLWCTENNRNKKFIISIDVTFSESAMFGQKEEVGNIVGNKGIHQKVELEVEDSNKENLDQSIATRRTQREIRKPVRYADVTCVFDTNLLRIQV